MTTSIDGISCNHLLHVDIVLGHLISGHLKNCSIIYLSLLGDKLNLRSPNISNYIDVHSLDPKHYLINDVKKMKLKKDWFSIN